MTLLTPLTQQQPIARKTDAQIQRQVIDELRWDTRVKETDVGVEVDQGVVTLTGTVDNYGAKLAAQEAAHRVRGVLDVANDIRVHVPGGMTRTDTEIAQAVRHALEWDVLVPAQTIQSTVSNGMVSLTGTVHTWAQHEDAWRAVRHLQGVTGVINRLEVDLSRQQPVHASEVRRAIEAALERQAHREAKHLQVEVDDGVVTLRGAVRSWAERRAVLGVLSHAPGVRSVVDHLLIHPYD